MPKKGRAPLDPLRSIGESGFIGYVDEEETHKADEPGVIWVDIEKIQDNPYQHAEDIHSGDFQGLVASIRTDGFLGALNVSPSKGEDEYFLNGGGHQRRDAAREAGLTKLPVFVTETPIDPMVLALRVARENTTRVNTSMINLGNLYQQMIDEFDLTQEEIANRIQKDRNHVKFALTAARSPKDIQDMLRQRPDSLRAMTYFRRLALEEDRRPIMDRFLAGELSTEGVRQEVETLLERQRQTQEVPAEIAQPEPSRDEVVPVAGVEVQALHLVPTKPVSSEVPPVVPIRESSSAEMQPDHQEKRLPVMPRQASRVQSQQLQMVLEILQSLHRQAPLLETEYRLLEQISGVAQQLQQQEKAVSQET